MYFYINVKKYIFIYNYEKYISIYKYEKVYICTQLWRSIHLFITYKMKRSFFQAAVSILLDGCTTWTLTKRLGKKLDGNYTKYCEQSWSPGGNTQQGTNYTITSLPSRKLSKLDQPNMQDTAGEAGTSS